MKIGKQELWILRQCAKNPETNYPGYAETMRRLRRKGLLERIPAHMPDNYGSNVTEAGLKALEKYKATKTPQE